MQHSTITPSTPSSPLSTSHLTYAPAEVGVLERDGLLEKNAARTLDDGVRNIRKALRDETRRRCPRRRDKLVQDYDKGAQDGTITPEATAQLDPLLADLNDAVDAYAAG